MTSSIAFCWADEPSAFSVPASQLSLDGAALDPPSAAFALGPLSSLPHAVSSRPPAARTAAVREKRVSFTVMSSKDVCVVFDVS